MASTRASVATLALALAAGAVVHAQTAGQTAGAGGIYTCVDAKGRTLTADRPIAECLDRDQTELNPSGSTRRKIEPSYTAQEIADREARERQAQLAAQRQTEERRRERALLLRYPNAAAHDKERSEALVQIDAVIQAARKRLGELADDRKRIDGELEFYAKDPSKAPDAVRRKLDDNVKSVAVQNRFIADQEDEKKRVNDRFDEEQARLKPLWAANAASSSSSGTMR